MTVVNRLIFDVDGTLTPSRGKIDPEFEKFFFNICKTNYVYLVTGSDRPKTVEQVGNKLYGMAERVYNCSGCDVYKGNKNIHTSSWTLPKDARHWLESKLEESTFPLRTGNHIEERPGIINYSIVGRNATLGERKLYVDYDTKNNERNTIARAFNNYFPRLNAVVGGETGMDIFQNGFDKSQIIKDFDPVDDIIHFFGDAMHKEGNDYPLKKVIIDKDLGHCYNVKNYKETWKILKDEFDWNC